MGQTDSTRFQAVSRRRLTEDVVDQIEQLILSRELRPGDRLPAERELAAQLQVSRNVLREATSTMVQKGLLEVRPGSGAYVAQPNSEFLRDTLDFFVRFNEAGLTDLMEVRRSIEIEIAGLAAERANEEECDLVAACLRDMGESAAAPDAYVEADARFHECLAKVTGNRIMQLLIGSIRGALRENIRVVIAHRPSAIQEAIDDHRRITRAMRRHTPDAARRAMREHLAKIGKYVEEL